MGACNYSLHSIWLMMRRFWSGWSANLALADYGRVHSTRTDRSGWLPQQWWAESSMILTRDTCNRVRYLRDRPSIARMISGSSQK